MAGIPKHSPHHDVNSSLGPEYEAIEQGAEEQRLGDPFSILYHVFWLLLGDGLRRGCIVWPDIP